MSIEIRCISWLILGILLLSACLPTPLQAYIPRTHTTTTSTPQIEHTRTSTPRHTVVPENTRAVAATPTVVNSEPIDPASLAGVRVSLWHPWMGIKETYLELLVTEFNTRNEWGIKVITESLGSSSELGSRIKSSPYPDLVIAYPDQAQAWLESELPLVDLNDYVLDPNYGLNAGDLLDYTPLLWEAGKVGELQVGIPAASSMVFLLYNVDWAKELGFSRAPITPDEFRQQACAAAKANRLAVDETLHGTGGWLVNTDALSMLGWASAFGGSLEPDENGSYQFNTSQIKYAFTYLNNLYTAGCAWNGRSDTPFAYFASRYALFTTSSLEDLAEQISVMGRMNSTDRWTVLPFPSTSDKPVVVSYGSDYYLVQSTAERQLAAWLFLRWISSPEQDVRFVRGTGIYPARLSSLDSLGDYLRDHSQWSAAVALLSGALPSPTYSSWQVARAIIQDGAGQLFQTDTQPEQVGQILQQMDALAAEVMKVSP